MKMLRKKLIEELGTREDGKFPLFNLEELKNLIKARNFNDNWHCLGREKEREGKDITYCVYAYQAFSNNRPIKNCTADCEFYRVLHSK